MRSNRARRRRRRDLEILVVGGGGSDARRVCGVGGGPTLPRPLDLRLIRDGDDGSGGLPVRLGESDHYREVVENRPTIGGGVPRRRRRPSVVGSVDKSRSAIRRVGRQAIHKQSRVRLLLLRRGA